jgi:hypothetical protein
MATYRPRAVTATDLAEHPHGGGEAVRIPPAPLDQRPHPRQHHPHHGALVGHLQSSVSHPTSIRDLDRLTSHKGNMEMDPVQSTRPKYQEPPRPLQTHQALKHDMHRGEPSPYSVEEARQQAADVNHVISINDSVLHTKAAHPITRAEPLLRRGG